MKWSEIQTGSRASPSPGGDRVEDRIFDHFSRRLNEDCVFVARDSRLVEDLRLRGPAADEFLRFLEHEFGFRPDDRDPRAYLARVGTLGALIDHVRSGPARAPAAEVTFLSEVARPRSPDSRASRPPEPPRREPRPEPEPRRPRPDPEVLRIADTPAPARPEGRAPEARAPEAVPVEIRLEDVRPVRRRVPVLDGVAFTQYRDKPPTAEQWRAGPLFEPFGKTREGRPQFLRRTDGMRCVLIPKATVTLGSDRLPDAAVRRVNLGSFLVDAEPVSASAYARFLNALGKLPDSVAAEWFGYNAERHGPSSPWPLEHGWLSGWSVQAGLEMHPMVQVSWYGANAYSLWANRWDWRYYLGNGTIPEVLHARRVDALPPSERDNSSCLPSEAQWEYAARGPEPARFPWGDSDPDSEKVRSAPSASAGDRHVIDPAAMVHVRLGVSPFGLHHMAGPLKQWCRDCFQPDFPSTPAAAKPDPCCREPSDARSTRAGIHSDGSPAECAARSGRPAYSRGRLLGFRCVGASDET